MRFPVHTPVLIEEVIELLNPQRGQTFVDATVNGGGHTRRLLEKIGSTGMVIAIDWDGGLLSRLQGQMKEEGHTNIEYIQGNFRNLTQLISQKHFGAIDGVLFDFGFSSYHVDSAKRGFSFQAEEPLDMRYDIHGTTTTAHTIINTWSEDSIANILRDYGEERYARPIAHRIRKAREKKPIETTGELVKIISHGVRGRIHPATRTFQALRIAVNDELQNIEKGLIGAIDIVKPGGVIAAISFHSLEDRIVKNIFRDTAKEHRVDILTKKPIVPTEREIRENPRARSAKLRGASKHS